MRELTVFAVGMLSFLGLDWRPLDVAGKPPGITIIIVDADNSPVREVDVEVRDRKGDVVLRGAAQNGVFEIQDLGFGPHSIVVGKGRCGEVELKRIYFYMDSHTTYRMVHNGCPHSGASSGSGCLVTFRVRTAGAGQITGAVISAGTTRQVAVTDTYGRATAVIGDHQTEQFTVEAADHRSESVELKCSFPGMVNREVVLSRRRR
jgi:hypothetical protein